MHATKCEIDKPSKNPCCFLYLKYALARVLVGEHVVDQLWERSGGGYRALILTRQLSTSPFTKYRAAYLCVYLCLPHKSIYAIDSLVHRPLPVFNEYWPVLQCATLKNWEWPVDMACHQLYKFFFFLQVPVPSSCVENITIEHTFPFYRNKHTETVDPVMVILVVNDSLSVRRIVVFLYLLIDSHRLILRNTSKKLLINRLMGEPSR